MRWSIRLQLFLPLATLLLGVIGISAWTAAASAGRAWRQVEGQVRQVGRTLAESDFPLSERVLQLMKGLSGAEYVLAGDDGRRTGTLPAGDAPLPPAGPVLAWDDLRLGPRVELGGRSYFCTAVRMPPARAPGGGTLYVLYPESLWRDALWAAVLPSLVLGLFGGLASLVLMVGVAKRIARRVRDVERHTGQIASGDFSPMPLPAGGDELRDLAVSVNRMARRLAELQQAAGSAERLRLLGQVSGGLAHQLRNGITGARLAVQVHARECSTPADGEALDVALRQLALVESGLKRFLDLGKPGAVRPQPCDLRRLVDEAVSLLRPQCRHADTELRWERPAEEVTVAGDPGRLGHAVLNLIGNAVEAAGPGGWVDVTVRTAGSQCAIEVTDSGPGPPAELAGRLSEPFVTGKPEGVGLGLAVARQAAEAHGGRLDWERRDGVTCFRVTLPLSVSAPRVEGAPA